MIDAPSGADMEGIYSAGSRNSNVVDRTLTIEGCKDVAAVIGEEEDEGQSVYVHIWEQDTLSSSDRFVFPVTGSRLVQRGCWRWRWLLFLREPLGNRFGIAGVTGLD